MSLPVTLLKKRQIQGSQENEKCFMDLTVCTLFLCPPLCLYIILSTALFAHHSSSHCSPLFLSLSLSCQSELYEKSVYSICRGTHMDVCQKEPNLFRIPGKHYFIQTMKSNGIPASPQGRAASKVSVAQDLVCFSWALQIFHQYAIICLGCCLVWWNDLQSRHRFCCTHLPLDHCLPSPSTTS